MVRSFVSYFCKKAEILKRGLQFHSTKTYFIRIFALEVQQFDTFIALLSQSVQLFITCICALPNYLRW